MRMDIKINHCSMLEEFGKWTVPVCPPINQKKYSIMYHFRRKRFWEKTWKKHDNYCWNEIKNTTGFLSHSAFWNDRVRVFLWCHFYESRAPVLGRWQHMYQSLSDVTVAKVTFQNGAHGVGFWVLKLFIVVYVQVKSRLLLLVYPVSV